VLVACYLPNRGCSSSGQGAPTSRHYRRWIDRLVDHLGSTRAAVVVEPDAVAADCFDTRRAILRKHSVRRLAGAGQYVYLDAGHPRRRSTGEMAQRPPATASALLRMSGTGTMSGATRDARRWASVEARSPTCSLRLRHDG
jgi:Glycosyl hydrolases family 6